MNKKFLSAILFGALMVTSTGTFVSCKDYDDDIDQINQELTEIKSQVAALQSKIESGKWITSVSQTTGGFSITFSDGSNYNIVNGKDGVDGAAGAAGAAGTQWTINEEGYWVCDGVATDVKAVGIDGVKGEDGEDAQPEVKKEDGKWYLWNGEDWEAIVTEEAPVANLPYYYTDPNNGNYAYLVICDKDGKNEQTFRLPLNEGLTQIVPMGGTSLNIAYGRLTKDITNWAGSKPAPKKGEYVMSQESAGAMMLQVTPVNYDLAQDELTLVSGNGVEAPVTLGTPVALNGDQVAEWATRAVSKYGVFSVPFAVNELTEEMVATYSTSEEDNANGYVPYLMIKAGENTASAYNAAYLKLNKVATVNNIAFGAVDGLDRYGKATPGKAVTLGAVDNVYQVTNNGTTTTVKAYHGGNIYDTFVTYEGSDADSILNKVVIDGMNVTVNAEKGSSHKFKVTWLDVNGAIGSSNVIITYQGDAPATPETVTSIATTAYTATTVTKDDANSFVVDFAPYFNTLSSSDRILWNDDAVVAAITNNIYYEYTEENQYGVVETKKVYLKDVVSSVKWLKTDGKTTTNKADYAKLKVVMNTAYTAKNVDDNSAVVYDFGNGTFTMDVTVKSENLKIDQTIKVPFTIAAPTQTEIDKQVVFNEAFFDATSRVYTVLNDETLTLSTMFTGELTVDFSGAELGSGIKWNSDAEKGKVIKLNGDKGVASTISKAKVTYMSRPMQISTFSVKFADEKGASINFGKALEVGCANGTIKVKNGTTLTAAEQNSGTYYTYYQVKTFNGQVITPSSMTVDNTADLKYIDSVELSGEDLVVKTKADKIANDVTEKVKVTFNGTYTVEFNVKVLGIAAQ